MLVSSVIVHGRRIYKRGIGHVLKLMTYLEQIDPKRKGVDPVVAWALREFTDINCPIIPIWPFKQLYSLYENIVPSLFARFRKMTAMVIVGDIVAVNVPKSTGATTGSKRQDIEDTALGIIDMLAAEYGWNPDWILEHVTLDDYKRFAEQIKARRANETINAALVAHDPQEAVKRAKEMCGITETTLQELMAKKR